MYCLYDTLLCITLGLEAEEPGDLDYSGAGLEFIT